MRWIYCAASALVSFVFICQPSDAGLISNGSFESGLDGWSLTGDVSAVDATIGVNPPAGTFQALLTSASQNGDLNNFSGFDAISAADLEIFLGLALGSLGDAFEGSAITQSLSVNAGETLHFDFKFLTTDTGRNDFAFVVLNGAFSVLADTTAGPFSASSANLDPVFDAPTTETGWRSFQFSFTSNGAVTLGLGVADLNDDFLPSALVVDNVRLEPSGPQVVPEPGGLVLMGQAALFLAVGWRLRWRHREKPLALHKKIH